MNRLVAVTFDASSIRGVLGLPDDAVLKGAMTSGDRLILKMTTDAVDEVPEGEQIPPRSYKTAPGPDGGLVFAGWCE